MDINIRDVRISDAAALLKIYSYYVTDTAISFEIEVPDISEFERRIKAVTKKFPYLVAEVDNTPVGFAYAHPFIDRAAYDHCAEVTAYISSDYTKHGLGKALYLELEKRLKAMGIKQLYACIARTDNEDEYLTNNSPRFHEHIGYKTVGVFKNSGCKFGRYYDMIYMEKLI